MMKYGKKEAEGLWEDFKAFPKEDKKTFQDYNSMIVESNSKRFESFFKEDNAWRKAIHPQFRNKHIYEVERRKRAFHRG